jgi:hypothetical protein
MDSLLLWLALLVMIAAGVSYAIDAEIHERIMERLDRHIYSDGGECRVIDQWWHNGTLYTSAVCDTGYLRVNGKSLSFERYRDDIDAAMVARHWVENQ